MDLEWFPFYWRDFDEGTRELTNEELGAYWRLLYYQWQYGSIPADRERAARLTSERFSDKTWEELRKKFVADPSVPPDRLVNLRMQRVRAEQEQKAERRFEAARHNGRLGGLARAANRIASKPLSNSLAAGQADAQPPAQPPSSRVKKEDKKKEDIGVPTGKVSANRNRRGTRQRRAPSELSLTPGMLAFLAQLFPKVQSDSIRRWADKELAKFKDHEFNTPKSDWEGTLRNWFRRCAEIGNIPAGAIMQGEPEDEAKKASVLRAAALYRMTRGEGEEWHVFAARVKAEGDRQYQARLQQPGPVGPSKVKGNDDSQ